ncbi:hypothetical protein MJH54_28665, partial [Salmonella enterica subsp. enterica serovar Montevideo]|nr:hypothetical protein [Salmonella enterica subsp. enterica serovar Montevideo]
TVNGAQDARALGKAFSADIQNYNLYSSNTVRTIQSATWFSAGWLSIWILIRILKDELILAYSTASSESVLPRIIEKMEAYGAPAS